MQSREDFKASQMKSMMLEPPVEMSMLNNKHSSEIVDIIHILHFQYDFYSTVESRNHIETKIKWE